MNPHSIVTTINMAYIFSRKITQEAELKPVLDCRVKYKDNDTLGRACLELGLSSDGVNLDGSELSCRLNQRRAWPMYQTHSYAYLTYYRDGYTGQGGDKTCVMDMYTFQTLFKDPKNFLPELREQADDVVKTWNSMYSGQKMIGKRRKVDQSFVISEIKVPYHAGHATSQMVLTISSFNATRKQQHSSIAKLAREDLRVSLKLRTTLPSRFDRKRSYSEFEDGEQGDPFRYNGYGVYLSLGAFEKLANSKEIKALVEEATKYLDLHCPPVDHPDEDDEDEYQEVRPTTTSEASPRRANKEKEEEEKNEDDASKPAAPQTRRGQKEQKKNIAKHE